LSLDQWVTFWWVPALFAGVVLVFFLLFFRDEVEIADESVASVMGAETSDEEEAAA
jgi:Flp pilus assembly protein protease CpaA